VIPEIDIWRAGQLMLKRYGEKALDESGRRLYRRGGSNWRQGVDGASRNATIFY
jgi:hypothetical protein